jgi:peptidyl-prolyl cis-trans isomerase D
VASLAPKAYRWPRRTDRQRGDLKTDISTTMISLFRNFFQSKIGLPIFIGFLIIVALAFAASDISGSSTFGGIAGSEDVAVVGEERITANELRGAVNNGLARARDENPTITMPQFVAGEGLSRELELLIDRYAVGQFAEEIGLRAGQNLVNSEILQIGAFRSLTGEFDEATYRAALRDRNITDAVLRKDIADGLLAQMVLRPAFAAPQLPEAAARQYAALVLERRRGQVALIPSDAYAPEKAPSDRVLEAFYSETRQRFVRPESRTLRFAAFGVGDLPEPAEPTPAQIAARYEANPEAYAAQDRRGFTAFVVPTREGAQALVERVRGGLSLEAAAAQAGFAVSDSDPLDREALAQATSFALAEAIFAGEEGAIVDPARSALGWYVARIDTVERVPARSLADARGEIAAQIREQARAAALADLSTRIEQRVDDGTSLTDVAREFDLEVTTIDGVTADGRIAGNAQGTVSPAVQPLIETAFQMDEGEPQLAEIVPGAQFVVFDVPRITASAAPPLSDIRQTVVEAWRRARGSQAAKAAADRILAAVRGGKEVAAALQEENVNLGRLERIDLARRELLAQTRGNVPAPLVLMFSMAEGSTKVLEGANDAGWYLVNLDEIVTEPVDDNPEILAQTRAQLAPAIINEYNAQLTRAIRQSVGVERNAEAIEEVRRALAGES